MMKRKLIPAGHRVLVKLNKIDTQKEVKTESGLIIEIKDNRQIQSEKYGTKEARVIALGQTAFRAYDDGEPWCKVGDLVMVCKYSGDDRTDIEDDEVYRIINDEDVLAIFAGE